MNLIRVTILFFATFIFIGCANQKQIDVNNMNPKVILEDDSLNNWLDINSVNYLKREDALLKIQASFKNTSSFNKKIIYKIQWLDENNFVEKTLLSRWIFKEVAKEGAFLINGISPSPKTKDFKIIIRLDPDDNTTIKHNENFNN